MALRQMASSGAGTRDSSRRAAGDSPRLTRPPTSSAASAGGQAVSMKWSVAPRPYTSLAGPTAPPAACSGLMYAGVPTASPSTVSEPSGQPCGGPGASPLAVDSMPPRDWPMSLANPQSTTRVSPNSPSMMFVGLMSRWSTPRLWA